MRTPPAATVCATEASRSGVASTLPWPIAVEPTSSGVPISLGRRQRARQLAQHRRAARSSRSAARRPPAAAAPTFTPSGANTELHEWAKLSRKLPPQDSPFAFSSSTPSIKARGLHGELVARLDGPRLERGGGRDDLEGGPGRLGRRERDARPARGSRRCGRRARRRRRAVPPARPPPPAAGGCRSWCARRFAGRGPALRARAPPASSSPPGLPGQLGPRRRARGRSARRACRAGSRARRARRALRRRASAGASVPAIEPPGAPSGELRASGRPSASTLPSRASRIARRGGTLRASTGASPGAGPGKARCGSHSTRSSRTGTSDRARTARRRGCARSRAPPRRRRARPRARRRRPGRAWPWPPDARVGAPERRQRIRRACALGRQQGVHGARSRRAARRRRSPRPMRSDVDGARSRRCRRPPARARPAPDGRAGHGGSGAGGARDQLVYGRAASSASPTVAVRRGRYVTSAGDLGRLDHRRASALLMAVWGYAQGLIVGALSLAGFAGRRLRRLAARPAAARRRAPTRPTRRSSRSSGRCCSAACSPPRSRCWASACGAGSDERLGLVDGLGGRGARGRARPRPGLDRRRRGAQHARARASCASRSSARRSSRSSTSALPPSGPMLKALARFDPFPQIEGPEPGRRARPTRGSPRDPQVARAGRSVVKVLGTACGLGVQGSGWVAGDGLVVTNAHVVAGQDDTTVQLGGEGPSASTPRRVWFDARNDLAHPARAGIGGRPGAAAQRRSPARGTGAAILGFPENGPYDVAARRASGRPRPSSPRTPTAAARCGGGSPRCAGACARATPAARWSTAPGRVLTTIFAATVSDAARAASACPTRSSRDASGAPAARSTRALRALSRPRRFVSISDPSCVAADQQPCSPPPCSRGRARHPSRRGQPSRSARTADPTPA